jgi:hypothetical protein
MTSFSYSLLIFLYVVNQFEKTHRVGFLKVIDYIIILIKGPCNMVLITDKMGAIPKHPFLLYKI